MEVLKVGYADFWPEWPDENFIEPILKKHFQVVIDQKNPDVLFHSIFGGGREAAKYNCKKIQFIGENRRPSNTTFSISFDPHSSTNFRLPLWQAFLLKTPELLEHLFKKVRHSNFETFCSFTVSNPNNFLRNSAYQQVHNYKPVNSYGRFMTNNYHLQEASKGRYWRDAKFEFFFRHGHKFSIVYENNSYPWYCTEKLMDAFLAGSIPIYWGDPYVGIDWNEKAFINAMKTPDILSEIKKYDNDWDAYREMSAQPVFTLSQKTKLQNNLEEFEHWLINKVNA